MEYIFLNNLDEIKGINAPKSPLGFSKMVKLCESAEMLFDKKGFFQTSIADICRAAHTAVGTFYIYFQDKTAIYNYLVRNYYVVIKRHLNENIAGLKTRLEIECAGLRAFIRFGHTHPQCYKIIWGSSYISPDLFENYYTDFAKSYVRALDKTPEQIIDVDYSTAAFFLMGIANFICLKTIFNKSPLPESKLDEIIADTRKILTEGLFKRKEK
ncbi:MAG: TetR/AcrR family transcriptional regulator [Clostridiales bacterium]|jgi:AcrR family transcriptional regulator|nr:TetR/AcrR family transcriptional regulator [Clostridiales bacterium]